MFNDYYKPLKDEQAEDIRAYCRRIPGLEMHADSFADLQTNALKWLAVNRFFYTKLFPLFEKLSESRLREMESDIRSFLATKVDEVVLEELPFFMALKAEVEATETLDSTPFRP